MTDEPTEKASTAKKTPASKSAAAKPDTAKGAAGKSGKDAKTDKDAKGVTVKKSKAELERERRERKRLAPSTRRWVPPTFITVGLLGGLWIVTYYIAGARVPGMRDLGDWNVLIGMGLLAASFAISTLWK